MSVKKLDLGLIRQRDSKLTPLADIMGDTHEPAAVLYELVTANRTSACKGHVGESARERHGAPIQAGVAQGDRAKEAHGRRYPNPAARVVNHKKPRRNGASSGESRHWISGGDLAPAFSAPAACRLPLLGGSARPSSGSGVGAARQFRVQDRGSCGPARGWDLWRIWRPDRRRLARLSGVL